MTETPASLIRPVAAGQAAIYIVAGMATLGLTDNLLRLITETSSLWQFHMLRSGLVLAILGLVVISGRGTIRPRRPGAVIGRSLFTAGALVIYFGCLAVVPIGVVVAGLFTAPLFVLLIAVVFQGERVGLLRGGAIIAGFLGALMVIRPDPQNLDLVAFLPVVAGILYAIGAVAMRAWCEGESTLTMTFWFFVLLLLAGSAGSILLPGTTTGAEGFVTRGWMPLRSVDLLIFPVLALGAVIGILCIFRGYQVGQASSVAVFEYTLLIFASVWAWVLWGETLSVLAIAGMGLIALAGIVIAMRSPS